ncbi:hypothetical protein [Myroides pelagicus]|uniref:DUF4402 domain-containing protein n=1 Tax=Myroides pelagicus TaxID=270914 RepID=A0A7K1GRF4_9FLAO|nr:hypothetical protein [Myroides pelagicus]MTH30989.1 hypothetical protein [Myroides pelagicus]
MKPIILFLFLVLSSAFARAQQSADSLLKIVLTPIQSIKVNAAQHEVNLEFDSTLDYTHGVISSQEDHLEVMSSQMYEVRVGASTDLTNQHESIDLNLINLTPSLGSIGEPRENINLSEVQLSLSDTHMIRSEQGDVKRSYNIDYKMEADNQLMNKTQGEYNTIITYTILSL